MIVVCRCNKCKTEWTCPAVYEHDTNALILEDNQCANPNCKSEDIEIIDEEPWLDGPVYW